MNNQPNLVNLLNCVESKPCISQPHLSMKRKGWLLAAISFFLNQCPKVGKPFSSCQQALMELRRKISMRPNCPRKKNNFELKCISKKDMGEKRLRCGTENICQDRHMFLCQCRQKNHASALRVLRRCYNIFVCCPEYFNLILNAIHTLRKVNYLLNNFKKCLKIIYFRHNDIMTNIFISSDGSILYFLKFCQYVLLFQEDMKSDMHRLPISCNFGTNKFYSKIKMWKVHCKCP